MAPGATAMGSMVKGKGGEWEERTDGIMQILRTICLKCECAIVVNFSSYLHNLECQDGAALFYTTPLPVNLQVLRQYALHLLFMPPAPSPAMAAAGETQAPVRNLFPFTQKPNTLDRDRIVVPAGWDSWGKISVLREGFDAKMWGEAWERDLNPEEGQTEAGAKKAYANLVPDQGPKVKKLFLCLLDKMLISCYHSHRRCLLSTIPCQSRPSSPKITTRTRRRQTGTPAVPSGLHKTYLQASSVLWEAAASACRTSNAL